MAGKLVHVEIDAADSDRAQGFWSGVFGWEIGPPMSPEMDYRMFRTGEDQGGAISGADELRRHVVEPADVDLLLGDVGGLRCARGVAGGHRQERAAG